MKRLLVGTLVAVIGFSLAAPHVFADTSRNILSAEYRLGSDKEGRSTLTTIERVTLATAAPLDWTLQQSNDGHPLGLQITGVTDGNDMPLHYTTTASGDTMTLKTEGNAASTYVIAYTQHDVTKYLAGAKDDEFDWPVLDKQEPLAFGIVSATIHLSDSISPTFTKKLTCEQGTKQCEIMTDGKTVRVAATNVTENGGLSISVGFTPGTFRGYQPSSGYNIVQIVVTALSLALIVIVALVIQTWRRHRKP